LRRTTVVTITSYRPSAAATRRAAPSRPRMERVLRLIDGLGGIVADSVRAARAYESAPTTASRQAVLDRFAAQSGRHDLTMDATRS
jgi:hypothetical protein